ncbi:MAG: hypothetical protein HOD13_01320 [Rhodospirillaceae bacterium]|jgi:hypothetical protein|nr:hypothetical protein [Rhodospirillaceae bacterium]
MKKIIVSLIIIASQPCLFGQNKWAPYVSVEEGIHISDVRPSYNFINLSVPAGNAGMRMGAFYTHDDKISAEATLGVIGISTPNSFSSGLIPIEVIGHYNVLPDLPIDWLSKFNLDLGIGTGFAESRPGNYGFAEHMVVGATAELGNLLPFGTLMIGTRYTMFIDDYIDGYVDGPGNDKILRFFTGVRIDLGKSNIADELLEAKNTIDKLSGDLTTAVLAYDDLSAQKEDEKSRLEAENAKLKEQLQSTEKGNSSTTIEATEIINEFNGYHVVIGSFPEKSLADDYSATLNIDGLEVKYVESIPTYRVVLSEHKELRAALEALENARGITPNAWIAVY